MKAWVTGIWGCHRNLEVGGVTDIWGLEWGAGGEERGKGQGPKAYEGVL